MTYFTYVGFSLVLISNSTVCAFNELKWMCVKIFSASTLNDVLNGCFRSLIALVFNVVDPLGSDWVESFIFWPLFVLLYPIEAVTLSLEVLPRQSLLLPDFDWRSAPFFVATSWLALLNVSLYLLTTYKRWKYASNKFSKIDCTRMYKLIWPKFEARNSINNFKINSMFNTFVSINKFRNVANRALRIAWLVILAGNKYDSVNSEKVVMFCVLLSRFQRELTNWIQANGTNQQRWNFSTVASLGPFGHNGSHPGLRLIYPLWFWGKEIGKKWKILKKKLGKLEKFEKRLKKNRKNWEEIRKKWKNWKN